MANVNYNTTSGNTKIINGVPGAGNELTCSINVGNNSNRVLDVRVSWTPSVGNNIMNDTAGIVLATVDGTGGGDLYYLGSSYRGGRVIDAYRFVAPQVGSRTVTIRFDDLDVPGSNLLITSGVTVVSLYDVNQSSPVAQTLATNGSSSPITATLNATAGNMLVDGSHSILSTTLTAQGTNQTLRWTQQFGTSGSVAVQGASTMPISSSGSKTMQIKENTTTRAWCEFTAEYVAVTAVPISVGFHTSNASSVHAAAVGLVGAVLNLYPGPDGQWVTAEWRHRKRVQASVEIPTFALQALAGEVKAYGKAAVTAQVTAELQCSARAVGYVGPSDEEVAQAIALLLNRSS